MQYQSKGGGGVMIINSWPSYMYLATLASHVLPLSSHVIEWQDASHLQTPTLSVTAGRLWYTWTLLGGREKLVTWSNLHSVWSVWGVCVLGGSDASTCTCTCTVNVVSKLPWQPGHMTLKDLQLHTIWWDTQVPFLGLRNASNLNFQRPFLLPAGQDVLVNSPQIFCLWMWLSYYHCTTWPVSHMSSFHSHKIRSCDATFGVMWLNNMGMWLICQIMWLITN